MVASYALDRMHFDVNTLTRSEFGDKDIRVCGYDCIFAGEVFVLRAERFECNVFGVHTVETSKLAIA